jgi:hypothetical protein
VTTTPPVQRHRGQDEQGRQTRAGHNEVIHALK